MNQLFSGLSERTTLGRHDKALCSPIEGEGDDPSHIDMGVGDRGELGDDVVRERVRILIQKALYALCIPSHDNVGQQGQGSGDGLHLLGRPAVPGADGSGLNGSLQAVNRFTLLSKSITPSQTYRERQAALRMGSGAARSGLNPN